MICAAAALAVLTTTETWSSWALVGVMLIVSVGVVWYANRSMVTVIDRPAVFHNREPFGPRVFETVYRQIFDLNDLALFDLTELIDSSVKLPAHVEPAVRNFVQDKENVHNSFVQTGLSKYYTENLRTAGTDPKTAWQTLSAFFGDTPVLGTLLEEHPTQKLEMYDSKSVLDILYDVYQAGSANVRSALASILPTLDDDMCPTGKASRIVEAAFIEQPENTPTSKIMVQTAMLHKASALKAEAEVKGLGPDETKKLIVKTLMDEYAPRYGAKKVAEIIAEWQDIY